MCGRFYLDADAEFLLNYFKIKYRPSDVEISPIVYPSQTTPIIIGSADEKRIGPMYWGFSIPNANKLVINARSETVLSRPMFKRAFQNKRCLIPASGFFEWHDNGSKRKEMYSIGLDEAPIMTMAGIYRKEMDAEGRVKWVFSVITCDASDEMKRIHDRMPVLINPENHQLWLDSKTELSVVSKLLVTQSPKLKIQKSDT